MEQCVEKSVNELSQKFNNSYDSDSKQILSEFAEWSEQAQNEFFNHALSRLSHTQLKIFDQILNPLLQKDIIGTLSDLKLSHISAQILGYLDPPSLIAASNVSKKWNDIIYRHQIWKKLINDKLSKKSVWRKLLSTSNFGYLFADDESESNTTNLPYNIYEKIYYKLDILENILHKNWEEGKYKLKRICCENDINRGVYCIQYDDEKIICGLRDNTIKVWCMRTHKLLRTLKGHEGSVLCLQYKDSYLISGSSDSTIRIWNHETTQEYEKIESHKEPVLHLKFNDSYLITCSKDYTITVFQIEITHNSIKVTPFTTLREHKAAVNVIDFDDQYLVSASGDRNIKVWEMGCFNCIHTLTGHRRGIACLQYFSNLIISGSSDHTIRVWDINIGSCIRILFGHEELVRCIRFDSNFIISGAYDGKIKVWKLNEVIDKNIPHVALKATTLCEHTSRVFKLQFDAFKIVSSSQDDTILIWDFLGLSSEELERFWNLKLLPASTETCSDPLRPNKTSSQLNSNISQANLQKQPISKIQKTCGISMNPCSPLEGSFPNHQKDYNPMNIQSNPDQTHPSLPRSNQNSQCLVEQRENHPISRMLRKCLSLKKTRKDHNSTEACVSSSNPTNDTLQIEPIIIPTSKKSPDNEPTQVFINSETIATSTPGLYNTSKSTKATSILMDTDSPIKEVSASSSNQEEDQEEDETLPARQQEDTPPLLMHHQQIQLPTLPQHPDGHHHGPFHLASKEEENLRNKKK